MWKLLFFHFFLLLFDRFRDLISLEALQAAIVYIYIPYIIHGIELNERKEDGEGRKKNDISHDNANRLFNA